MGHLITCRQKGLKVGGTGGSHWSVNIRLTDGRVISESRELFKSQSSSHVRVGIH